MLEPVSDPADPRLHDYIVVSDPELARDRGLFVAEGRLVVRRLIEDGRHTFRSLLVSDAALRSLDPVVAAIPEQVPIYVCAGRDFVGITGHDIHRGCLALVERLPARRLSDLLHGSPLAPGTTLVVLEGVTNPDNVGATFRNAAAFGAAAVLLSPSCCDPLYRKAIRTSMAATLRVPYALVNPWPDGLADLRAAGFVLTALTPSPTAQPLAEFRPAGSTRIALLVGTEGEGLSRGAEALADCRVRIPVQPEIDSLNLAVATGIALHHLSNR